VAGGAKWKKLRTGYTTGACAAAASAGAVRMLTRQCRTRQVTIPLPAGGTARFAIKGATFRTDQARCYVVKNAGDDPDVTHGAEIHSEVVWDLKAPVGTVTLQAGPGVGQVTKPGLAVAPGEPAINPVPRRMIEAAIHRELQRFGVNRAVKVTISVPDGEERATRTLNARLGIVGGLSILGTTGIVRPISHQAWRDTIEAALDVALASGVQAVVLSGGRTSELAAQQWFRLPDEAFVLMGDHVGFTLESCVRKKVPKLILSMQFAKLVKVAAGHADTHAQSARLDLQLLAGWAIQDGLDASAVSRIKLANTAREAFLGQADPVNLARIVADRALLTIRSRWPELAVGLLLVDYAGQAWRGFGDVSETGRD
jgi:cobalt-precorrin-5B (C1)-methyltransferase